MGDTDRPEPPPPLPRDLALAFTKVVRAIDELDPERQARVLRAVAILYGVEHSLCEHQ